MVSILAFARPLEPTKPFSSGLWMGAGLGSLLLFEDQIYILLDH